MKNLIIGTTTGAVVGATISMFTPCKGKTRHRIFKRSKHRKFKSHIMKNLFKFVYKFV